MSEKSINSLSKLSQIDRRTLSPWLKKQADKILSSKFKRTVFKVSNEKDQSVCPLMENELKNWIIKKRNDGICVSGNTIQNEALQIYNNIHPAREPLNFEKKCPLNRINFKASRGWLLTFVTGVI
jgi:hypothetical protein